MLDDLNQSLEMAQSLDGSKPDFEPFSNSLNRLDYGHDTLDFNRDLIRHPETSSYGDVSGKMATELSLINPLSRIRD